MYFLIRIRIHFLICIFFTIIVIYTKIQVLKLYFKVFTQPNIINLNFLNKFKFLLYVNIKITIADRKLN